MKFLVHSNAPWMTTGYGTQSREIARHLLELGQEVDMSVTTGHVQMEVRTQLWRDGPPVTVLPMGNDDSGSSVILGHVRRTNPDWVLTLYDACGMVSAAPGGETGGGWGRFNFRWLPYGMVDDGPPLAKYHKDTLAGAEAVLALTKFGAMQLAGGLPMPIWLAPHSLDPAVFRNVDQSQARTRLGFPQDRFITLFCGDWEGWPGRKGLMEAVEAFARLGHEIGFKDVMFMAQTKPCILDPEITLGQLFESFDVPSHAWRQEQTHFVMVGRPVSHMVDLYNAADVLILPSRAEAFGLTAVEAEMCGTPTIVTDEHGLKETCHGPWKVPEATHHTSWKLSRWAEPDTDKFFEALRDCYRSGSEYRNQVGLEAQRHAIKNYSRDVVREDWKNVLAQAEERMRKAPKIHLMPILKKEGIANVVAVVPFLAEKTPNKDLNLSCPIVMANDVWQNGYPATVNAGAKSIKLPHEWLLIWNDDAIADNDMLSRLLSAAGKHDLVLAAPVVNRIDEERGVQVTELGWEVFREGVRAMTAPWNDGELQMLGGSIYQSLFLIRRDVWNWAEGFDERYSPGYYEDADLVRRVVAGGYKAATVLDARCIHFAGHTFNQVYSEKERMEMLNTNRRFYDWKFGK